MKVNVSCGMLLGNLAFYISVGCTIVDLGSVRFSNFLRMCYAELFGLFHVQSHDVCLIDLLFVSVMLQFDDTRLQLGAKVLEYIQNSRSTAQAATNSHVFHRNHPKAELPAFSITTK